MLESDFEEDKDKTSKAFLYWTYAVNDAVICDNLLPRKGWPNAYEPFDQPPPVNAQDLIRWGSKGWAHIHALSSIYCFWSLLALATGSPDLLCEAICQ